MRFDGTRVIVTGGARGIGRGIVDAFLAEGAHVVATDRLDDALASLRATHPESDRLSVHTADLADVDQVHGIVPAVVGLLGGVDVLVNNAGVQPDGPFLDVGAADIDGCLAVNVRAPMLLMRDVCRHLIDRGAPGSIVNIASANAFQNESPEAIYNASKAALVALTNALAHEVGHLGIRANCVAPGETITPEATREPEHDPRELDVVRRYLSRIPLQHAGTPRDQAMAVLFLASDDARFTRPDARGRRRGDRGRQVVRRRPGSAASSSGQPDHGVSYASPRARRIASFTSSTSKVISKKPICSSYTKRSDCSLTSSSKTCNTGSPNWTPANGPTHAGSPSRTVSAATSTASASPAPSITTMSSAPNSSTIRLIRAWFSGSIAPDAVQTKHSVRTSMTSAPALRATAAIASPGTLSRSPSAMTFLPCSSMGGSPPLGA